MGEEKKAPRNRLLRIFEVGSRASAWGSVAFKSERFGKIASFLVVNAASLETLRIHVEGHLAGRRLTSNKKRKGSSCGHLVVAKEDMMIANAESTRNRNGENTNSNGCYEFWEKTLDWPSQEVIEHSFSCQTVTFKDS